VQNSKTGYLTLTTPISGKIFLRQGGTCYGKLMYQIRSLWVHALRSCEWRCNRNYVSIFYRFRDKAGYLSKVADFDHPTCIRRPRWGWPRSNFAEIFGTRKLESLGYRVVLFCVILRLAVLVELRFVTDTDRRKDTGQWLVPRMHSIAR